MDARRPSEPPMQRQALPWKAMDTWVSFRVEVMIYSFKKPNHLVLHYTKVSTEIQHAQPRTFLQIQLVRTR
jgi:hypothetical protein